MLDVFHSRSQAPILFSPESFSDVNETASHELRNFSKPKFQTLEPDQEIEANALKPFTKRSKEHE